MALATEQKYNLCMTPADCILPAQRVYYYQLLIPMSSI